MRRRISSKSNTCTESMYVYAAGISVKVGAHYPGRSVSLSRTTGIERCREELAEVSRGHSSSFDRSEGPNVKNGPKTRISMIKGDAERRAEKHESHPEGSRRNRREEGLGASRVTAKRETSGPETEQLMEAVVERENMKVLPAGGGERDLRGTRINSATAESVGEFSRESG